LAVPGAWFSLIVSLACPWWPDAAVQLAVKLRRLQVPDNRAMAAPLAGGNCLRAQRPRDTKTLADAFNRQ